MPDNTIEWGQGAVNNTNDWGKAKANSTNNFGAIYDDSPSGDTNIAGGSPPTPSLAQVSNVYSMSFNGVNDFINISNPTELTSDFTISAWILPTRVNNSYEMIYTQGTPYFAIRDTRLHFYFSSSYETGLNFITANEWQHVAVTRTSGVLNLYRNGVEYNGTRPTQNGTINNDSDGIIGKWFNSSHYFKGKIDELAIFNTALTAQEIQSIYNATETGKTADLNDLTTPPVKWYRMGD